MKALLLIAHGSRAQAANDEIEQLAQQVRRLAGDEYDIVQAAFLEMAAPDIHQGIDLCVAAGARSIVVVPYFLAAGNHVVKDIPGELACARVKHPQIDIESGSYIGSSQVMADLILNCANSASAGL